MEYRQVYPDDSGYHRGQDGDYVYDIHVYYDIHILYMYILSKLLVWHNNNHKEQK